MSATRIAVLAARRGKAENMPLASRLDLDTTDAVWYEAVAGHKWELGQLGVVGDDRIVRIYEGEPVPQGAFLICVADVRELADFKSMHTVKLSDLGIS